VREWRFAVLAFAAIAILFTATGLLPHRVMLPLDLPRDSGAWKADPNQRVVVSNKLLSDPVFEYLAWDREIRRLLGVGMFPWRNRFAGDGAHLFANPETALLFPLTWPRIVFGDRGWAVTILLKLFFAGLGMWWFARVLTGCGPRAAIVAGFAYMSCGFMTVWLLFPHTNVYAVLPWLGACALRADVAGTIVTAALATAGGHPETLCFGVIALAIFLAWERPPRSLRTLICAAIGFAICAVQLVPFLIALSKSEMLAERAHRPVHARIFAIPATILPGFLGSPLGSEIDLSGIAQPAAENFSERSGGYAGAVVLLIVLSEWPRLPRSARRGVTIGCVALGLSWISFSIAANERLGLVFAFFVCASLGSAIEVVQSRRRIVMAICAAAVLIAGIFLAMPFAQPLLVRAARSGIAMLQQRHYLRLSTDVYESRLMHYIGGFQAVAARRIAVPAACVLAAAIAMMRGRRRLIVAAIAAEMATFAYGYNPAIDISEAAPTPLAIREISRRYPEHHFLIAAAADVYPPNMGTIDGVRDVRSYDVLQTRSRIDLLKSAGYDTDARAFPQPPHLPGVRWFVTAGGFAEIPGADPLPWPQNTPPDGLALGAAISSLALLAAAITIVRTR